ncbi:hypothetical protein ABZY44_01600 [Streptomyces sp. NPDC006544]|uniref:hypothetical protein n=1 Tax=Streptomyces sp. NPDC006544 TaxID=3154583 RepID=UPI0033B10158
MIDIALKPTPGAERRADRPKPYRRISRSLVLIGAEVGTSLFFAGLLTYLGRRLRVNPMERIGQVSGLAAIQLRLLVLLGATVLLYLFLARMVPAVAVRVGAAAVAGLATGVTAAGHVVALRGADWPLNGLGGDIGYLQQWGLNIIDGVPLPSMYPPGFPYLLAGAFEVFGGDMGKATKWMMIGFVAVSGPVAYLVWRMLLPPLWALGVGVTAMLPLVDLYKPYSALVLVVVIPVLAKLLDVVQRSSLLGRKRSMLMGGGLGAILALIFLLYSGWFVWSAVGVAVLFTIVLALKYREGGKRTLVDAVLPLGASLVVFLALAGKYMVSLLRSRGTKDTFFYFDTSTDPAYFAMWGNNAPGAQRTIGLPPLGELGGVQLFSVVLVIGLATALGLALRKPAVITLAACAASAFLLRYWYASHMEQDGVVQLYPRTSHQITYCLIALTGLAAYYASQRVRDWMRANETRLPNRLAKRSPAGVIGALCAMTLLFGMAGSATANQYMPGSPDDNALSQLAWNSHNLRQGNGKCPMFAIDHECGSYFLERAKK